MPEFNIKENDKRAFKGRCKKCDAIICFKRDNSDAQKGLLEKTGITFSINGSLYNGELTHRFKLFDFH